MSTLQQPVAGSLSELFAQRTNSFGVSIWSDIFRQFTKHEDPVYFGDGSPEPSVIPVDRLREAAMKAWDDAPGCLKYGDQQGYPPLREWIANHVAARGIQTSADNILITAGSTQGLDYACRTFLDPGDTIIVEVPTFLGAIEIFETYGVNIVGVEDDGEGMHLDALEAALEQHPEAKVIYTIPTFQNPSGTTLPLESRQRLIELAEQYNAVIFEDDPYGELRYSGEPVPPLRALSDRVLHFGTFSKTIAPGIRTGYVIAPDEVLPMILSTREVADISNDRIMMRTVYHTAEGFLEEHVQRAIEVYRSRRDAMLAALETEMPAGITWSRPEGGFFVWITLPEDIDVDALFDEAAENGVIFFPGEWFDPARKIAHTIRLSFSTVPEDRIRLGIQRLGEVLRRHVPA